MRELGRRVGDGDRSGGSGAAASAPGPGKQTRVGQLESGASGARTADVDAVAARGTAGAAQPYPHRGAIEAAVGRPVPAKAFFGPEASAACAELGAEAYTVGDSVAFAAPDPSPRLAGHEAAHVLQQTEGVHLSGGDGSAHDPLEHHADAVGDRVAAGRSADDLSPRHGASQLPAAPQRKQVQRKAPDHKVTSADLTARAGEQHAAEMTAKQIRDAIAWNNQRWTGAHRKELRAFLQHGAADDSSFTESDVRAARAIQLGAGVDIKQADGMIGDTTMAILLHAGLTLGAGGSKARPQDVELLFVPGEFEDVAQWQAAATQAIKKRPDAPYRELIDPSGTGRIYVKIKGNIVDVVNARGGPAVSVKDFGGHTADPTTAGTWTLGGGKSVVTAAWDKSQIPWGADVRKRADGNWEFKDPDSGKWKIATGTHAQIDNPLSPADFDSASGNQGRSTWLLNDFGEMGWRIQGTDGQFIHTTPQDEKTTLPGDESVRVDGSGPALTASHGCVHVDPAGRNRLRDRGYLQGGVTFVVRKYTVHLLPEAMRLMMQGEKPGP